MKNKRGQFYLIAAIAIIALIMGLIFIGNTSSTHKSNRVDVVASELSIESAKFLDRAALSGTYNWHEFTANFSEYESDVTIVYITGTDSSYEVYKYDKDGTINYSVQNYYDELSDELTVYHEGANYSFQMMGAKTFYYIISIYIGDNKYVKTN